MDANEKPTVIKFDLIQESVVLLVSLDILQYAKVDNHSHNLSFKQPIESLEGSFPFIYIAYDKSNNKRARFLLLPYHNASKKILLSTNLKGREPHVAKKLPSVTHARKLEKKYILQDAGVESKQLLKHYDASHDRYDIFVTSGHPHRKVAVSLERVNVESSKCFQADYTIVYISNDKLEVLIIVGAGKTYGERSIASFRLSENMKQILQYMWFCRHRAPKRFSADIKFCIDTMKRFLLVLTLLSRSGCTAHCTTEES